MEFRQAFDTWKSAHHAAQQAELLVLRPGLPPIGAEERRRATELRRLASQCLREMLAAAAAAAAVCRPPEDSGREQALEPLGPRPEPPR